MSSKNALPKKTLRSAQKTSSKASLSGINSVQTFNSKPKVQTENLNKDIKQCFKLLESGDVHLIDLKGISEEFLIKPYLGDKLQYELHNYCKRGLERQTNVSVVIKLAELCYSNISVSGFTHMDRFVGCVYYISAYLLKKEEYNAALEVSYSLTLKKEEIMKFSKENMDIRSFICSLHNNFISSAIALATKLTSITDKNYKITHKLANQSLKFFHLTNIEQFSAGRKLLKTSKLYLHSLKYYDDKDILHFYKTLKNSLKIILPNFSHFDYLSFFLHKLDPGKNLELTKGFEIQSQLRKILNFISVMAGLSLKIKDSLCRILDFFFNSDSNIPCDEIFNDLQPFDSTRKLCFILLSIVFNYGIQFWWKTFENNWNGIVSTDIVLKLFEKFIQFHKSNCRNVTLYCTSVQSPYETCYADLLSGNLQKIQYTIRLCLKARVSNSLILVPLLREAFKLSIECVDEMKTRGCCNIQRSYAWKHSVIHHTNAIEDILRQATSDEWWLHLRDCSEEVLKAVVNSEFDLPYDFRRVTILFQRWHFANLKLNKFYEALFVCAAFYVSYPAEEAEIMSMWVQTKSESGNEIFEEVTLMEILNSFDKALVEFNDKYNKSNVDLKSVLMIELKAYSFCPSDAFKSPKASHKLIHRLWKELGKISLNIWETSFGLTCLISTKISQDDDSLPENIQEQCKKVIDELLNWKRKGKPQCRSLLHAANLIFFLFLYEVRMAENSDGTLNSNSQVLSYLKKAEEEKVKFGEDVDFNLTCNLIPSSSHLTVDLETNYLDSLNGIVNLWTTALNSDSEDFPSRSETEFWLQAVEHVARLYELFGEHQRSFTTWLLFYKIAEFFNDSTAGLLALSHLMENISDVNASDLTKEAEAIAGKVCHENKEKNVLVHYWMTVASNHLKNNRPDQCLEYLRKAKKVLESLRTTLRTQALKAKFWCLVSQFLCAFPDHEVTFGYSPGTDFRVMVFKAFTYASAGFRSDLIRSAAQGECLEMVLAMIKVNLWAYHFHRIYLKTDFMRLFLDDLYQIVQQLFLPTRTAEMLLRLAEVDAICEKETECQAKMAKLRAILTTLPSISEEDLKSVQPKSNSSYPTVVEKTNFNEPALRPISPARFLDRPDAREADPSPVHFHLPRPKSFNAESHSGKCKCRTCQNILVQILTMDALALEAEISRPEIAPASSFARALDVLNHLELLKEVQSQVLRLKLHTAFQSHPGQLDFQTRTVQFYSARLLIKQCFFELHRQNTWTERTREAMSRVERIIEAFSFEDKLLVWAFTELKLSAFELGGHRKVERHKSKTPVEYKTLVFAKTPFNAHSDIITCVQSRTSTENVPKTVGRKSGNTADGVEKKTGQKKVRDTARKSKIQPKKLSFQTNELSARIKTVRKAPEGRLTLMKPRKLDLEEIEADENAKPPPGKASTAKSLRPAIKVHVDSTQTRGKKEKKSGEGSRIKAPGKALGRKGEKKIEKVGNYSMDLFET